MIISNDYIYLEPLGVSSARGYQRFLEIGAINQHDITTGCGVEGFEECFAPSQNWQAISRSEYSIVADKPLRVHDIAGPLFDHVINKSLTLSELIKLGLDVRSDVPVIALIRNPIDRAISLFFRSAERRHLDRTIEFSFYQWLEHDNFIHYLWKHQCDYHKQVTHPVLYEDFDAHFTDTLILTLKKQAFPDVKRPVISHDDVSLPYWYIGRGVPEVLKPILEDRYHDDIELWIKVYKDRTGKEPKLYR